MDKWGFAVVLAFSMAVGLPCCGGAMNEHKLPDRLTDIPAAAWEDLAGKKICFGHQSVGANILEGIKVLMQENPQIKLTIVESTSSTKQAHGAFQHFRVGKNLDPNSKIASFTQHMGLDSCRDADVAFFKFCYVDITPNTNPEALFENYRSGMKNLAVAYPRITFVHVTLPLVRRQTGLKALIKRMSGRPVSGYEDNIVRNRYNALLLNEYGGKAPLFDLARFEATNPDGSLELFNKNGSKYLALVPGYTYDDGHLNEAGRRVVAVALLRFLASSGLKGSR